MKNKILFSLFALLFLHFPANYCQIERKAKVNDTTYMLTYDHGGLILWGSDHFRERLGNAIDWLDKYPSFKIGLDNEAHIYDYFAENEPQMLEELNGYLRKYNGRFGIGSCTYGQPLSQFINDESNIRQISYALRAGRRHLNYRPPVYLMSEHAMHSQIPQILKGFGFDGAIMRTHFMMYGYNPVFNTPIGWWIGLDGTKIPTIPTYPGQGAAFGKTTMDTWILTRYPSEESPEPMESFRKKFRHINPLLASRADDSGLRREELVKEYEKKPRYSWILLDDLLGKYPEPLSDMVTKPDDFTVRMPWGYCGNEIWNESRKAETKILTAEKLAAIESISGGKSYLDDIDISWKSLLLAQHHDIQICGLLPESRKLIPESLISSQKVIDQSMRFFSENMHGEGLRQVTVFNPLSWKQSRWIFADIVTSPENERYFVAKCGNRQIPARIISANRNSSGGVYNARIAFKAELDPLSIMSFSILPAGSSSGNKKGKIEYDEKDLKAITPFYEVRLSEKGGVSYIKDISTGRLITGGKERAGYFEGTIDGQNCQSTGRWIVEKTGEVTPWIRLVEYGFISSIPYEFEMVLYEDMPRIDCRVKFDFNNQKIGMLSDDLRDSHSPFVHEEKLRFKLFHTFDASAAGIRDLPFAIAETHNKYVEGNYWSALSDGRSGIAFFNRGNMGTIREADNSFSIPLAYAMYYIWGTRMLTGSFSYEFSILPFDGNWREADLHRKALEYAFDAPSFESKPNNGKLGNIVSCFNIDAANDILLTAMYPEKDVVYARFFKYDEINPVSSLKFGCKDFDITEIDLDGNFMKDIDGLIDFNPWEIKTICIKNK